MERLERRRSPRVSVTSRERLPIGLRDISLGGFAVETPAVLPKGSLQDFQLRYPDGAVVILRARVAYSRRERTPHGRPVCVTGAEFVEEVVDGRPYARQTLAS